jgi:superoxide dismutase, Fe-Mn family
MRLVKSGGAVEFEIPELPYPMDALEPVLSRETLEYHYGAHHLGYVEKLNSLVSGTRLEHSTLEQIVRTSTGAIFNNAAQVWNHNFYWECMGPHAAAEPNGDLATRLRSTFGSFESFKQVFKRHAVQKFGSGWTWLVKTGDGLLVVRNTDDADTPIRTNETPLLCCDVWEHAYYVDYRNDRAKYVDAFLGIVNWKFAERQLKGAAS